MNLIVKCYQIFKLFLLFVFLFVIELSSQYIKSDLSHPNKQSGVCEHFNNLFYIYMYIQVHLNKLECCGKVNLFQ